MDINEQLRQLKGESDALNQSLGLNRILLTLIDNQRRIHKWLCILLVISLLCNVAICCIFVAYESQFTTTTETITITQDTGEGEGNNVYQSGSDAQYIQGDSSGEVTTDGTTDYNYYSENQIPD
jgi:hypothetical protein